jgi:hypothetical protein
MYASDEIDAVAAFCPEVNRCYYLPFERIAGRTQVDLRVTRCRNNQQLGINWAEDFEFSATLRTHLGP